MMELYLNIIEFGPDIYGAREAAHHYFGREPDELNLAECLFLSSIMPSPLRFHKMYERGEVPDAWLKHLRQLMKTASKVGTITPSEYEDGLKEVIVFHKEGDPPPPPRTPAISARQSGISAPGAPNDGWDTPD
jgi:membrane peptidoglycan carboxypeptidase